MYVSIIVPGTILDVADACYDVRGSAGIDIMLSINTIVPIVR